jgi:hypothetical protein
LAGARWLPQERREDVRIQHPLRFRCSRTTSPFSGLRTKRAIAMRSRLFALVLLGSFVPVAAPAPVWAQSAVQDANTTLARARFKEGVAYFDSGRYELARAAFLQAYTLKKHPAILGNLAWSCVKSGHFLEAHRYFEQFLAESTAITAAQQADVADGLSQTDARLGHIEIPAVAGSDVSVDGERVGTAPLSGPVAVSVGAHTIEVRTPNGATSTQSVTVIAGERKVAGAQATPPGAPVATGQPAEPEPHRAGFWPVNMIPIYVGGGTVVVGAGIAIGAFIAKQSAQDNANTEAQELALAHGSCPAPRTATSGQVRGCATLANDNTQRNQDATTANVALGIGVAAIVGTVVYWIVATKRDDATADPATAMDTKVVPFVGPSFGGLSVSTRF